MRRRRKVRREGGGGESRMRSVQPPLPLPPQQQQWLRGIRRRCFDTLRGCQTRPSLFRSRLRRPVRRTARGEVGVVVANAGGDGAVAEADVQLGRDPVRCAASRSAVRRRSRCFLVEFRSHSRRCCCACNTCLYSLRLSSRCFPLDGRGKMMLSRCERKRGQQNATRDRKEREKETAET
jgi:hypothetical protein